MAAPLVLEIRSSIIFPRSAPTPDDAPETAINITGEVPPFDPTPSSSPTLGFNVLVEVDFEPGGGEGLRETVDGVVRAGFEDGRGSCRMCTRRLGCRRSRGLI